MTKRFAVVKSGTVENVILWDGETPWTLPEGAELVELNDSAAVSPGFLYQTGAFVDPRPQNTLSAQTISALEQKANETAQRLGFNGDPGQTVTI